MYSRYTEDDVPAKQEPAPEVKLESAPPVAAKAVEPVENVENSNTEGQAYDDEQDADDDIDFNLGNGNGFDAPAGQQETHGPGIKEDG
jgi:RNA-binding protein Musashi